MEKKMYKVLVDDNFHFMDKSERYNSNSFATYQGAVVKCKAIINDYLLSALEPGMTSKQLFTSYAMFGENPFIFGGEKGNFKARDYACVQCETLIKRQNSKSKKDSEKK